MRLPIFGIFDPQRWQLHMVELNTYHTINSPVTTSSSLASIHVDIQSLVSLKSIHSFIHHLLSAYYVSVLGDGEIVPSKTDRAPALMSLWGHVAAINGYVTRYPQTQ